MNQHVNLQILPPALTLNQWMAYTGCSRSAFFRFAKEYPRAMVRDAHKQQRCLRAWADAFVLGRIEDMRQF